ncbi:MAG: hypothetical protein ABJB69_05765 [Spartobacteria bacterium]
MADTVDDFMKRFGSGGTVDEQQAAQFHDRFVSTKPEDNQFNNGAYHDAVAEHLGTLPDDQFRQAAQQAVAQSSPEQREGLLGGLLGALGSAAGSGGGGGLGQIAGMLGLGSTDPRQMSSGDAAKLMNYARTQHPEVLRQTVAEKPWFLKALGNPIVVGALTMAATRLISQRRNS